MAAANARIEELEAQNARLQREVEHRLNEMNLQARWTREAQEKVERLRAALKPFVEYERNNKLAHDTDIVGLTMGDMRAALKAMDGT